MRHLYEGGVCFEITFLKSLTTVTENRFRNIMYFKGSEGTGELCSLNGGFVISNTPHLMNFRGTTKMFVIACFQCHAIQNRSK